MTQRHSPAHDLTFNQREDWLNQSNHFPSSAARARLPSFSRCWWRTGWTLATASKVCWCGDFNVVTFCFFILFHHFHHFALNPDPTLPWLRWEAEVTSTKPTRRSSVRENFNLIKEQFSNMLQIQRAARAKTQKQQ